jgi:hypothetical protein
MRELNPRGLRAAKPDFEEKVSRAFTDYADGIVTVDAEE